MTCFPCSYLKGEIELSAEREQHILERHPELLPNHRHWITTTLADPYEVRRSARFGSARLFSRWYTDLREGKHIVVVVVSELDHSRRHWIITAYAATRLAGGDIEWKRS